MTASQRTCPICLRTYSAASLMCGACSRSYDRFRRDPKRNSGDAWDEMIWVARRVQHELVRPLRSEVERLQRERIATEQEISERVAAAVELILRRTRAGGRTPS